MQGGQHSVAPGGFPAEGGAQSNPGRIPGSEQLPALFSFGSNILEGDTVLREDRLVEILFPGSGAPKHHQLPGLPDRAEIRHGIPRT